MNEKLKLLLQAAVPIYVRSLTEDRFPEYGLLGNDRVVTGHRAARTEEEFRQLAVQSLRHAVILYDVIVGSNRVED